MNHNELKEKIRKSFGKVVPIAARESWGEFVREKKTSFDLRYEWIKDDRFFQWAADEIEVFDGEEWFTVAINRVGHT